ncbi:MAG: hypothetical protein KAJ65_07945 [Gammaproteobacteria bacterium]|nr:hypothetical protein [Gammaproteobacteria bacterium]
MNVNKSRRNKFQAVVLGGLMMVFGLSGTALGECIQGPNDPSGFNFLVDASSSCASMSSNMAGCDITSTALGASCTIINPNDQNEYITVTLTAGNVGNNEPISWTSTTNTANPNAGKVDFDIQIGATGGGSCAWGFTPGSDFGEGLAFLKSNDSLQKINGISFCSDFIGPVQAVSRLVLTKTITTESGTCGADDAATLTVDTGVSVKYCYVAESVGNGDAENVVLIDDNATPGDDSDDFEVVLSPLNGTTLNSGATAYGESAPMSFSVPGQVVNTATVTADDGATHSASATLDVTQALGTCPPAFQSAVDQQVAQTGEYPFAFLTDPKNPDVPAVCAPSAPPPSTTTVSVLSSTAVSCIEGCAIKPECVDTPNAAGCSPQVCQPSGAWTADDEYGVCGPVATDENSPLPFCWEVNQDLNRDCVLNGTEHMSSFGIEVQQVHSNPYVYQSCVKSRRGTVCTTTCYLYPGEDASVCPAGSTVQ